MVNEDDGGFSENSVHREVGGEMGIDGRERRPHGLYIEVNTSVRL